MPKLLRDAARRDARWPRNVLVGVAVVCPRCRARRTLFLYRILGWTRSRGRIVPRAGARRKTA